MQITTQSGLTGIGEATLLGKETAVTRALDVAFSKIGGSNAVPDSQWLDRLAMDTLPEATAASAVMQALWDLQAQRDGVTLTQALCQHNTSSQTQTAQHRNSIELYANINRRIRDRSPAGFVDSAHHALM